MRRTIAITLLVALASTSVHADDEATPINVKLALSGDAVVASFDVTHAFTEPFRKRLQNGLTSRTVIEMRLFDPDDRPLAQTSRRCRFQFDVWDEVMDVRVEDGRKKHDPVRRRLIDDGLRDCGRVTAAKLANRGLLQKRRGYHIEVLVQLNPISDEQIQRAREFMSNPRSSRTRSRSFFGAVAGFFSGTPEYRDDEFLFRSQLLTKPRGPK